MKKSLIIFCIMLILGLTGCSLDNPSSIHTPAKTTTTPYVDKEFSIQTDVIDGYLMGSKRITFAKGGIYTIQGSYNGTLAFASSLLEPVTLLLNETYLYNDSDAVIKWQSESSKIEIKAVENTNNYLEILHNNKYEVNVIDSNNNIEIGGKGNLTIIGAQKHAVKGSNIEIKGNVVLDITAEKDGLHGKMITINGGNTTIHDCNDAMEANINSKNLKGTILISNGNLNINNCITAFKADTSFTVKEREPDLTHEKGVINININKTEAIVDSVISDISQTAGFIVDNRKFN